MQEFFKKIQNMDIVTKMTIVGALVILFIIVTIIIVTFSGGKGVVDDIVPIGQEDAVDEAEIVDDTPKDFARVIAVVSGVDGNNGLLSITNVESYEKNLVSVPATLDIQDAFGESMALNQVYLGDLVEVKYDKEDMQAYEVKISNLGWEKASNRNMAIDEENRTITLFNDTYFYTDDIILSFGDEVILMSEIDPSDDLVVRGYKDTVWSISLKNKHGYLVLENTSSFIGGMVEIDQNYVTITENTRITVAVGVHNVIVTKDGIDPYVTSATILEGEDFILDLSEIQTLTGAIQFSIVQEEATLFVDNQRYSDLSDPINLDYGSHDILVEKEGYLPWTTILIVTQAYEEFAIDLDVQALMVKVDEPIETDLYIDGVLLGTIPLQAPVTPGTHVFKLERPGYFPKTQNIVIDIESGVFEINFPELIVDPNYVGDIIVRIDNPVGCELYIGASLAGTIPVDTTLVAGDYQLTIRKDGYTAKIYNITVNEEGAPYQYTFPDLLLLGQEESTDTDDNGEGDTPVDDTYVPE